MVALPRETGVRSGHHNSPLIPPQRPFPGRWAGPALSTATVVWRREVRGSHLTAALGAHRCVSSERAVRVGSADLGPLTGHPVREVSPSGPSDGPSTYVCYKPLLLHVVCWVCTARLIDSGARLCCPRTDVQEPRSLVATGVSHVGWYTPTGHCCSLSTIVSVRAVLYTLPAHPTHLVDCEEQRVRCQYVFSAALFMNRRV